MNIHMKNKKKELVYLLYSLTFVFVLTFFIKCIPNKLKVTKLNYLHQNNEKFENESYSIIIATWAPRRWEMKLQLKKIVYGQCPHLKDIFIYWVDKKNPLPDAKYFGIDTNRQVVPIHFIPTVTGFIVDRFIPPENLRTDSVLVMDDDLDTPGHSIDNAFLVYKENHFEDRIFGTLPRGFRDGKYMQYKDRKQPYTMVITNFAFLNIEMLKAYNLPEYKEMRDHCVNIRNCDDILMCYVVAHHFKKPPVAIKIDTFHLGVFGISFGKKHLDKRDNCCKYFQEKFGYDVVNQHQQYYEMEMAW